MNSNKQSYNPVSEELYQNLLNLAIQVARGFNVKLDYSNNSIKDVENILAKLHHEYKKTKKDEGLNGVAVEFAVYIIEVIRRNSTDKGILYMDDSQFGAKSFPFVWKGGTVFPYSWCQKRIFDGKADDVYFKYQSIVLPKLDNQATKKRLWGLFK